jgi:hypothetical protein
MGGVPVITAIQRIGQAPAPSRLIEAIGEVFRSVDAYGWDADPPHDAGFYLDPFLGNLPAYTLDWRQRGQSDSRYTDSFSEGVLIVRYYHELPNEDHTEGVKKVLALEAACYAALRRNRQRLGLVRFNIEGSFSEPSNDPKAVARRADYRCIVK